MSIVFSEKTRRPRLVLRDELLKRGWIHQIRQRSDGPAQGFCHPNMSARVA